MQNRTKNIRRTFITITAAGAVLLGTSACSSLSESGTMDRAQSYQYTNMQEDNAKDILPTWVPDNARDITLAQRTTGDERILTYQSASGLPVTCSAIKVIGKPSEAELTKGLTEESPDSQADLKKLVQDQFQTPLLQADWWPTGAQAKTTHLCGKWWVSEDGDQVYGFVPENKTVADGVKQEREKHKDEAQK